MASFIAKHTIGQFTKKLNPKNVLKNHDTAQEATAEQHAGGIDWTIYNYPRFVHICHYDLTTDPIPNVCKRIIRQVYIVAHIAQAMLVFNLITNIALIASKVDTSADHILYSVLHLILGSALVQFTWFTGYKGIAGELQKRKRIFYVLWSICCIVMVLYITIASGNVHGYTGIGPSQPSAYNGIAATESTLWVMELCLALYTVYVYTQYNGHTVNRSKESYASNKSATVDVTEPVVVINKYSLEAEAAASGRHLSKKAKERNSQLKADRRASG